MLRDTPSDSAGGFWHPSMAAGPIVILTSVLLAPVALTLVASVSDQYGTGGPSVTIAGYSEILKASRLSVLESVGSRAVGVACIDIVIALPLAYFAVLATRRWRAAILPLMTVPFLVSDAARARAWYSILTSGDNGQLGRLLLLGEGGTAVLLAAGTIPFAVFPILLCLPTRGENLWNACDELGVGPIDRIRRVVLPLGRPGVIAGWMCVFGLAFGASVEAAALADPMELSVSKLVAQLQSAREFTAVDALGTLLVGTVIIVVGALSIVVYPSYQRVRKSLAPSRATSRGSVFEQLEVGASREGHVRRGMRSVVVRRVASLIVMRACVIALLTFLLAPVISVIILSASGPQAGEMLKAYLDVLSRQDLREAWTNSLVVAGVVGVIAMTFGVVLGLTSWNRRWQLLTVAGLGMLALLPPDTYALGLLRVATSLGYKRSSLALVVVSHVAWALPFSTAVIYAANSRVGPELMDAAIEMGAARWQIVFRVLIGMTWPGIVSAFLVGALMSFNEYTRAWYLSGSSRLVSKYIYSKMASGADPGVYALGILNVLLVVLGVAAVGALARFTYRE